MKSFSDITPENLMKIRICQLSVWLISSKTEQDEKISMFCSLKIPISTQETWGLRGQMTNIQFDVKVSE